MTALDADGRQHQCEGSKNNQQATHRGEGGDLRVDHVRLRPDLHHGLVGVDRGDFFPNGLHERGGVGGGLQDDGPVWVRWLALAGTGALALARERSEHETPLTVLRLEPTVGKEGKAVAMRPLGTQTEASSGAGS